MREIIVCPICGKTIWSSSADPVLMRASISSRSPHASARLTEMVMESQRLIDEKKRAAEEACELHFVDFHSWRLWAWRKFRRPWLMTKRWPWSRPLRGEGEFGVPL